MSRFPFCRIVRRAIAALVSGFVCTVGLAQSDKEGFLDIAAHSHGTATLTVIISSEQVVLAFESPAFNLLGFENAPSTPEQEVALAQAEAVLASVENLVSITGARCEVQDLQISRPGQEAHVHEDAEHDDHDHGDTVHDSHDHADGRHWEFRVNATLHCIDLPARPALTATVFEHFSGIQTLELLWATDTQQGAATLSATTPSATLN
jgi:hypothetical protein